MQEVHVRVIKLVVVCVSLDQVLKFRSDYKTTRYGTEKVQNIHVIMKKFYILKSLGPI